MKKLSIMILTLLAVITACKKVPEVNKEYVDVERDLITVGTTSATIQCDYEYIATLKKAFLYYGEGEDATDMNVAEMSVVQKTLYVELAGLKENTTYSYYYEFVNGFNSMKSATKAFKTEGSPTTVTLPTVVTAEVTEITANSAKGGGEVTNDGGAEVTERGICWSTNANPTLNDSHVAAGAGTGVFTATMNGLEANTTYHVRAYAINEKGTAYGLDKEFATVGGGGSGVPEGAIDGLFSVSPTQKVYFSQGNLQYQASTNTWRFAEHQWDFVGSEVVHQGEPGGTVTGSSNHLVSEAYEGWIDLFAFGTSGYNHGAVCYQPWATSSNKSDYYPYGSPSYNLYDQTGQADWGCNSISNGGNAPNKWRTLKKEEMLYLLYSRNTEVSFVRAMVNGIKGMLLFPDDWDVSTYQLNSQNEGDVPYDVNEITLSVWCDVLEPSGVAFFPAAGLRQGSDVFVVNSWGQYTLSSVFDEMHVFRFGFNEGINSSGVDYGSYRNNANSVRLVRDVNEAIFPPAVITSDVSNVTSCSATCGGEVTSDGGSDVTERGICWSTNVNPTLNDSHVAAGAGTGVFTATMNGLEANTAYHVRAYATNEKGTAYGSDKEFTTLSGGSNGVPEGSINGLFTINANGDQVYFSQGNLQYQASTNTWRFAENQWDYVGSQTPEMGNAGGTVDGSDNANISPTYDGWIDLFGWGTSGWDCGNDYFHPYDYMYGECSYGPPSDMVGEYANSDWGYYNPIINGGNQIHCWRTLTRKEWSFLFNTRNTASGMRYVKACILSQNYGIINGVLLFPDNWNSTVYAFCHINDGCVDYNNNTILVSQWNGLESVGVVFLPAAGLRNGANSTLLNGLNEDGLYWSASGEPCQGLDIFFDASGLFTSSGASTPIGNSVRLVQDANP